MINQKDLRGFADKYVKLLNEGEAKKKKVTEKDVDPEELRMGIEIEKEHTNDPVLAKKIALDHLAEFPKYYTALKAMEKKMKLEKTATFNRIALGAFYNELEKIAAGFPTAQPFMQQIAPDFAAGNISRMGLPAARRPVMNMGGVYQAMKGAGLPGRQPVTNMAGVYQSMRGAGLGRAVPAPAQMAGPPAPVQTTRAPSNPYAMAAQRFQPNQNFKNLGAAVAQRNASPRMGSAWITAQNSINSAYRRGPQRPVMQAKPTAVAVGPVPTMAKKI